MEINDMVTLLCFNYILFIIKHMRHNNYIVIIFTFNEAK